MKRGVVLLSQLKKILISLPDSLLCEVDVFVDGNNINRSEFIREAMKLYLKEKRRITIRERLKTGYLEMSSVNALIAEECVEADSQSILSYMEKLAECE